MTISPPLRVEREGAVLRLIMSRPDKRNTINAAMLDEARDREFTALSACYGPDENVAAVSAFLRKSGA